MSLTPEQITALRDSVSQITDPIVEFLIADIAERVSEAGQLTSTASYEVWKLQKLGVSQKKLKKELRKRLKVSHKQLRQLLTQAAEAGYHFDINRFPQVQAFDFADNDSLQQILDATVKQAQEDLANITQTMGFLGPDGTARSLTDAYRQACDFAFEKAALGAQDYVSAVREATRGLAEKGILAVDYDSGVHTSLEAAVRRNVMGGLGIMQEQIARQNHDMLGCDGWEISAHMGSAPDHEPIQGKQYSDEDYTRLNNSLLRRIGTLNCGHSAMPIILGVNEPQYTDAELEEFRRQNETGVTYDGRHYTLYEATQKQRALERAIRKKKHRILLDEHLGDKEALQNNQIRFVRLREEYSRFSKAAGLPLQHDRMEAAGFTWKHGKAAAKTFDKYSKIRYHKDGTIVVTDDWKDRGKVTIPKRYLPNAVVETKTVYKNGKVQIDRTIYGEDALMKTQIHSGDHNRPDQHKFGKNGEHAHDYRWTDDVLQERTSRNLTDMEREQHSDILRKEQESSE